MAKLRMLALQVNWMGNRSMRGLSIQYWVAGQMHDVQLAHDGFWSHNIEYIGWGDVQVHADVSTPGPLACRIIDVQADRVLDGDALTDFGNLSIVATIDEDSFAH